MIQKNRMIKVCGMKQGNNIRAVEAGGADMIGFIFYPKSPRYVDSLPDYLPRKAKRVGVFVNENKEKILNYADLFSLNYIQLHGDESPGYCSSLKRNGLRIIKAFSIETPEDVERTQKYEGICSYYVFDTKTSGYGGSGKQFDWDLLKNYRGATPFLLSGGIGYNDIDELKHFSHPLLAGYDINSCFEMSPGMKDAELVCLFIEKAVK